MVFWTLGSSPGKASCGMADDMVFAMDDWNKLTFEARELKTAIEKIIQVLDKHHRNVSISRVTGSSMSLATGATALGLAIAAPFTLGVTLIPAIVLGAVSAVGASVSVGASVAEFFIKNHNVKDVQARWEKFRQDFLSRYKGIAGDESCLDLHKLNAKTSGAAHEYATTESPQTGDVLRGITSAVRGTGTVVSAVVQGAKAAAAGVRVASPLLSVASAVALPMDIVDLVTASISLRKGERSSATESLQQIVDCLSQMTSLSFDQLFDDNSLSFNYTKDPFPLLADHEMVF